MGFRIIVFVALVGLLCSGFEATCGNQWIDKAYNPVVKNTSTSSECQEANVLACTCFEVLQLNLYRLKGESVNDSDIKKGFRKASKFHHPDKKGGRTEDFQFLRSCSQRLQKELSGYARHVTNLEKKKVEENWDEAKFRARIEQLNEILIVVASQPNVYKTRAPPPGMHDLKVDRLFLFLDDSGSMQGPTLQVAHQALNTVEDRIERTPTSVHFIGSDSFTKFRFEDDVIVDDIIPEWTAGSGGTLLWQYAFDVISSHKRNTAGSVKDEALIITDGLDNKSAGAFRGIDGFHEMMVRLVANEVSLRISVLCIGNEDMCKVSNYRELAMATGGAYANVDPDSSSETRISDLALFSSHVTASNARRAELEIDARKAYEEACIAGTANEVAWYTRLRDDEKVAGVATVAFETVDL